MFSSRLELFLKHIGESPTSFEPIIGVSKGAIYKPIKNGKTIGVEVMEKIISKFPDLNLEWLITGNGEMLKSSILSGSENKNVHLISTPISTPNSKSEELGVQNTSKPFVRYLPVNSISVPILDIKAAAATLGSGHMPDDYVRHLAHIALPTSLVKRGRQYFFIPIAGKSMEPTLLNGDMVLASLIDRSDYHKIETGRVYVIATMDDGVVVKRVKNRLNEFGFIRAISDNVEHKGYNITASDIINVLEISFKISFDLSNLATNFQNQIDDLADRLDLVEKKIKI